MKKTTVLIFIKEKEPGLLALADRREKSLVPVFGGPRIIDYYTLPFISSDLKRIFVLAEKDMTGVKDHLIYMHSTGKIKVLDESDVYNAFLRLSNLRKNESLLLLRADGILITDWKKLARKLLALPSGEYKIVNEDQHTIGFYIQEANFIQKLKKEEHKISDSVSKIDTLWDLLAKCLRSSGEEVSCNALYFNLLSVAQYFEVHFALLQKMEEWVRVLAPLSVSAVNEESVSQVGRTGFVKNSYIAHSCTVNGILDHSILFPNVRIGKDALIKNSIIMENNYIGEGAVIQNTIVCSTTEIFSKISPNIGERARIGEDDRSGSNNRYPDSLHSGITLIGRNVEIPKDYKISRNCFIGSDVERTCLKGIERVKAGDSVLPH